MRNISAKKKAVIAILIICAAVTVFLCFGRAKLIDLENSYAGYVKTGLPYENLTWYKFTLPEKKQVLFDFWCCSSMPSKMTAYDAGDKALLESSPDASNKEEYTMSSSVEKELDKGTYYVKIEKLKEKTEGEFCFNYAY